MSGTGRSRRKARGVSPDASRQQKSYSIKYQESDPVDNEEYNISSRKAKNRSRKKKTRGRVTDPNNFSSDDTDNNSYRDDNANLTSDEVEEETPRSLRMQLLQSRMTEGNVSGPKQKKSKKSSHNETKCADSTKSSTKGKKSKQKDEYDFGYDDAGSVNSSGESESTPARHFNNDQKNSKTSPITLKLSKLDSKKWSRKTESKSKSTFSKSKKQSEQSIIDADDSDMVSLSSEKCWKSETTNRPLGSPSCKSDASSDDTIENNPVPNMELAQHEYSSTDDEEEETKSCDKSVRSKLKGATVSLSKYDSDQKWKVKSSDGAAVKLTCKKSNTGGTSVRKEEKPSVYSPSKSHGTSSASGAATQKNYDAVSSGESTEIEEYNDITVLHADHSPLHQPLSAGKTEDHHEDEFFRVTNRKGEKTRSGDLASGEGLKSSTTPNVEQLARRGGDDRPASQRASANVELAARRAKEPSSVQKRKPGRPRKVTQNFQLSPDNDEEFSTPAPKDVAETDGSTSKRSRKKPSMFHNYEVATPRRKQKSPRRIILNVEQSSMYDTEMDANYDVSDLSHQEDDDDSRDGTLGKIQIKKQQEPTQQCPRCDAILGSQTSLKYHLMSVHQVLWSKECPMGSTDNKALKFIMKKMGKLNCPKCGKEVRNFQYYNFHIEWCGREEEVAECPVCHKNQRLMYMASHVNLHKRKERIELERQKLVQKESGSQKSQRKRKAAEKAIGSLHEMSQELFSTDEMGDPKQSKKTRNMQSVDLDGSGKDRADDDDNFNFEEFDEGLKRNHVPTHSETHVSTPRSSGGASMWPSKDEDLFETCLQFHTKQEVLCPAFDEFLPTRDMFYHLTNEEIDSCLPVIRKSIDFSVDLLGRQETMSLGLFGSAVCGDSLNFFTGGPVWCAVWCPIPTTEGVNADQYLAVYSHKHMDETNVVKKAFTKTTVIQIWNCGPLNAFSDKLFLPHLAFGIVHDFGCVFSMAWCPFGAWQSCSQPVYQEEALHRLGLLATACSDGSIRIFSVPYASDLLDKDQCVGTYQFYRVKPSISLIPLPDQAGSAGSCCLCVDWQHGEERRYIVAGYADGATRLWDLKTQSPLLRTSISMDMSDVFLYPIRCFKSHLSEVRAVCWSQTVHEAFATCGADRDVKFWKTSDTSFPFCCEKFCQCMNARWVQPWNGVVVAQDDAFCFDHCCAYYQDAGYCLPDLYGRRSVMWHNACIWDVTHSSWLNVAVTCDSTGTLMLFKCMNLWRGNKSKKLMYRRHLLYETDVVPLSLPDGEKPDVTAVLEPRTYDEIVPKCQLTYKDKKMDVIKADVKFGSGKNLPRERVGSYPLPALYKVNFNPNFGSCSWLLSAGQAGLVRLHNLSGLFSANQRRIWTSQINR